MLLLIIPVPTQVELLDQDSSSSSPRMIDRAFVASKDSRKTKGVKEEKVEMGEGRIKRARIDSSYNVMSMQTPLNRATPIPAAPAPSTANTCDEGQGGFILSTQCIKMLSGQIFTILQQNAQVLTRLGEGIVSSPYGSTSKAYKTQDEIFYLLRTNLCAAIEL